MRKWLGLGISSIIYGPLRVSPPPQFYVGGAGALEQDTLTAPRPCFKRTPFLLWFHLTAPLKSHRRSQRSQKENKGRASEGEQKRRDPTTPRCVWVECVRAIFTVTKDKMDVFKDGIVFIFSKMIQRHLALPFSFLHRHLLDVISAEMIIIANVEA